MPSLFEWKRYWHPKGMTTFSLDGCFLPDPESDWGNSMNRHVVSLDSLASVPCLVLLGEQGIGKTSAIRQVIEENADNNTWLSLDTGGFSTEGSLADELFDHRKFVEWAQGSHTLTLFLDSLDEGPLSIHVKVRLLTRRMKEYPLERLRFRIACRSGMWPEGLEKNLRDWYGEKLQIYELSPLRENDVLTAARTMAVDPQSFINAVRARGAAALASRPLTLKFLLAKFRKTQQLSESQLDLMLDGMRYLCGESEDGRKECQELDADQRLAVAGLIAALTVFGNKTGIWKGCAMECEDDAYIPAEKLCNLRERVADNEFLITNSNIKEVISSGLFRSRGGECMVWGHQSYPECLAAWYCNQHMSVNQLSDLLLAGDGKLVPQMRGVAGWLASMSPELREVIRLAEPEALLQYEVDMSDEERKAVALACLELSKQPGVRISHRNHFENLKCEGLSNEIQPFIIDTTLSEETRNLAIEIGRACGLAEMCSDLSKIAFDPTQPYSVRSHAADAIAYIGDADTRGVLHGLTDTNPSEDPDDQLRGIALRALWPECMTTEKLFTLLTPPHNPRTTGAYCMFVNYHIAPLLKPPDLSTALKWVATKDSTHIEWSDKLVDGIIAMAWESLDEAEVREGLARAIVRRINDHQRTTLLEVKDEHRREILKFIIKLAARESIRPYSLIHDLHGFTRSDDVFWLIRELAECKSAELECMLVELIVSLSDWTCVSHIDALLVACGWNSVLAEVMRPYTEPVELGSEKAKTLRAMHIAYMKPEEEQKKKPSHPPSYWVRKCVLATHRPLDSWSRASQLMRLDQDGREKKRATHADITEFPGWKEVSTSTGAALLEMAKHYVTKGDPCTLDWLGQDHMHRAAIAGFHALHLLYVMDRSFVDSLPERVWEKWAPAIVYGYDNDATEAGFRLLQMAYRKSSSSVLHAFDMLLDHQGFDVIQVFDTLWDEQLAELLLKKVKDGRLFSYLLPEALRMLLIHDCQGGREHIESLLDLGHSEVGEELSLAVEAAIALSLYTKDDSWSLIQPFLYGDERFAKSFIPGLVHEQRTRRKAGDLETDVKQMVDILICMEEHFPGVGRGVTEMYFWRSHAISYLIENGEVASILEFRRRRPDLEWLNRVLVEAKNAARRNAWIPPTPASILCMFDEHEIRSVQTGDQLMDRVIESLQRMEKILHGRNPSIRDIWNGPKPEWSPKPETDLSGYVARHLENDLNSIVCNREVQARPSLGTSPGEHPDIVVDALAADGISNKTDTISVFIEVKGCWNRQLKTSMEDQLVNRYLASSQCQHGLYLVGWYCCRSWPKDHTDHGHPKRWSIGDLQSFLAKQASDLSTEATEVRSYVLDASLDPSDRSKK